MIRFPFLLITTLLTLSVAVKADYVYKCKSSEGRKVFSGFPCGPNAIKEEYRNLAPARKVAEDLPPRQGELLNKSMTNKKERPSATVTDDSKTKDK